MSIVIIGGHDRMVCNYKNICKKHKCKAKIFTQMPGDFKKQIGNPDLCVLFTNTVSHKMVKCALDEANFWRRCARGKHPFPFRTRRLSPVRPKVLQASVGEQAAARAKKGHCQGSRGMGAVHLDGWQKPDRRTLKTAYTNHNQILRDSCRRKRKQEFCKDLG